MHAEQKRDGSYRLQAVRTCSEGMCQQNAAWEGYGGRRHLQAVPLTMGKSIFLHSGMQPPCITLGALRCRQAYVEDAEARFCEG